MNPMPTFKLAENWLSLVIWSNRTILNAYSLVLTVCSFSALSYLFRSRSFVFARSSIDLMKSFQDYFIYLLMHLTAIFNFLNSQWCSNNLMNTGFVNLRPMRLTICASYDCATLRTRPRIVMSNFLVTCFTAWCTTISDPAPSSACIPRAPEAQC